IFNIIYYQQNYLQQNIKEYKKSSHSNQISQEFSIQALDQIDNFQKNLIKRIGNYCQLKYKFWQKLKTEGFQNMNNFQQASIQLSNLGLELKNEYQNQLKKLNLNWAKENITFFRIKSIYFALILNDFVSALKQENIVYELLQRDSNKGNDIVQNYTIIKGNLQLLKISISKDRGRILNKSNNKIANFFNYQLQDFKQLTYINDLMPSFLKNIHNQLITNMLDRGYSKLVMNINKTFFMDKQGFITPINIYICNQDGYYDDFVMNSFLQEYKYFIYNTLNFNFIFEIQRLDQYQCQLIKYLTNDIKLKFKIKNTL
ncbi:hypothetical protein IMG5_131600, partial [Ichthyophthirius multifiliis]